MSCYFLILREQLRWQSVCLPSRRSRIRTPFPAQKKTVKIASVAQWLECLLAKEKVVGSIPITRSNKFAPVVQLNRTPVYGTGNQGLNPCRGTIQIFHAGFVQWSRTLGFHPGNHGFESHTPYKVVNQYSRVLSIAII